jgi:hypothetical protein
MWDPLVLKVYKVLKAYRVVVIINFKAHRVLLARTLLKVFKEQREHKVMGMHSHKVYRGHKGYRGWWEGMVPKEPLDDQVCKAIQELKVHKVVGSAPNMF